MQGHPGGVQGVCPGPPGGSAQPAGADRHGDPGGYRPGLGQYENNYAMFSGKDLDRCNPTKPYPVPTIRTMLVWAAISWD